MEIAGRKMLKGASILFLIIGIFSIILSVTTIIGYSRMDPEMANNLSVLTGSDLQSIIFYKYFAAASGLGMLVGGLLGLVFLSRDEKVTVCLGAGIVIVLLQILAWVMEIVNVGFSLSMVFAGIIFLIIAAVYLVGAWKYTKEMRSFETW
ncbi:MAG: hypothetical protein RR614_04950 [Eubacterium sp.]